MAASSIVRPSVVVTALFVLGHGFHYLLLVTGDRLLPRDVFGLFYTSISLVNILLMPGTVVALMLTQRFATLAATNGPDAVRADLARALAAALRWGGVAAAVIALGLVAFGALLGIEAFAVVILAPAVALAVFVFEAIRSALQGLLRFAWFGTAWVCWRALQFVLAVAGFYYVGTVWSGLAGILLATVVASLLLFLVITPAPGAPRPLHPGVDEIRLETVVPFVVGYGLFAALANADALIAYLVLPRGELGVYASSSILPKAIVTATQPVAQIVMPVVVTEAAAAVSSRATLAKGVGATLALGILGWAAVSFGGRIVCGTRFGPQVCDESLLDMLALAAVPLGVLRVMVVANLARGPRWHTLVPALGLAAFIAVALSLPAGAHALARQYLVACWMVPVIWSAVAMFAALRRPPAWSQSPAKEPGP